MLAVEFELPAAQFCPGCEQKMPSTYSSAKLRGCLDFTLHKLANIAHGNGEIVLSLQVDPELWSVAEITAEAQYGLMTQTISRDRPRPRKGGFETRP